MTTRREVARAARTLLSAHPAMAPLWRLAAVAYEAGDIARAVDRYMAGLQAGTDAAADQIRWAIGRRRVRIVTHSSSDSVARAIARIATRVESVTCTVSLPGAEGRAFARRLERTGVHTDVIADAAVARACASADLVLVGADALTEVGVVNKVGTMPLALAAQHARIGAYAFAGTAKCVPSALVAGASEAFESTPLGLFDAILTERGPRRASAIARIAASVSIPEPIARLAR
jgi:translation initiation factor eIF-2B subunit delta